MLKNKKKKSVNCKTKKNKISDNILKINFKKILFF